MEGKNWFFMGLTDDRVRAYQRNETKFFKNPIDHIIQMVLIGRRPLIHQSAMLIQPSFVEDLTKGEESILRILSSAHQFRIISSEGDFNYWLNQSLSNGVYNSNWHLADGNSVKAHEYLTTHKKSIKETADYLRNENLFLAFPSYNPSSLLYESLLQLRDWDPGKIELVVWNEFFNSFVKTFNEDLLKIDRSGLDKIKYPPTRTHWENTVRKLFPRDNKIQSFLMAIVNERYHATFTLALEHDLADQGQIGVATTITGNYHGFDLSIAESNQDYYKHDSLPTVYYNPHLIREKFHSYGHQLFNGSELSKARSKYIAAISNKIDSKLRFDQLTTASALYEEHLARDFGYLDEIKNKRLTKKQLVALTIATPSIIALIAEYSKLNLDPTTMLLIHKTAAITTIATGLTELSKSIPEKISSLASGIRLKKYAKLQPVINYGIQPTIIEKPSNKLYAEALLNGSHVRNIHTDNKIKLEINQLRVI